MPNKYFQQMNQLWRTNPFFSSISVLATALTIAFAMTLYMVYSFRTADMAPESHRSRMIIVERGYSYLTKDHSNANSGLSKSAAEKIFGTLKGAEVVSYVLNKGEGAAYVGTAPSNRKKRVVSPVDDAYFEIFDFTFLAGKPFSKEQVSSEAQDIIITDKLAKELFNGVEESMGKNINVQFYDYRVVGVVRAVSSLFNNAYSDAWITPNHMSMDYGGKYSEGLRGQTKVFVLAKEGVSISQLDSEIKENLKALNDNLRDFTLEVETVSQAEQSFFNGKVKNPSRIFIFLIIVLLVVPAINMTGLLSTQLKKRRSEIGVRKAYGASNIQIAWGLVRENLALTLVGGLLGLILSFLAISLFKDVLLADLMTMNAKECFSLPATQFFSPWLFVLTLLFCMIINFLSSVFPLWNASRTSVIETIKGE